MTNRTLLIVGTVCLAVGGLPTLFVFGQVNTRDPNYGVFLFLTLPVAVLGAALVLLAGIKAMFLALGFGPAVATFCAGLIAIAQYVIGTLMAAQGMNAFASVIFGACGAGLIVISGVMWLRSINQEDPRR